MLPNPLWQNDIDMLNNFPSVQKALLDLAPYLKDVQNSFSNSYTQFYYWMMGLAAIIVLVLLANTLFKHKPATSAPVAPKDSGNDLYHSLLDQLDINTSDRNLLQQIAQDTRLRHPSVFLLSPDMLDWSKKIWTQEKGNEQVTDQQIKQIDKISYKLFGPSRSLDLARTQYDTVSQPTG